MYCTWKIVFCYEQLFVIASGSCHKSKTKLIKQSLIFSTIIWSIYLLVTNFLSHLCFGFPQMISTVSIEMVISNKRTSILENGDGYLIVFVCRGHKYVGILTYSGLRNSWHVFDSSSVELTSNFWKK
jgi:hypothetical protein